jgi:plastocyanin
MAAPGVKRTALPDTGATPEPCRRPLSHHAGDETDLSRPPTPGAGNGNRTTGLAAPHEPYNRPRNQLMNPLLRIRLLSGVFVALGIAACGGGEKTPPPPPVAAPPVAGGALTPGPGGQVIKIELMTDDQGLNKFAPNRVEAHEGDVLRYTLVSGVHNVHFLPDSNPGVPGLPPAAELLQLPGQTYDVAVSFKPGTYYFQCDPHALLGMQGHLIVAAREH